MEPEQQDRVVVVLVRARNPFNIGAVARAMHDFGFTRLRIVNEYAVPFAGAKSAVNASAVLAGASEYKSLAEAVEDCTLVFGSTAVGDRALEHPLYALEEAADRVAEATARGSRVALLFGSEKTGLSNDELSYCHALLTIPMNEREVTGHLSMNLGQAAAVCLYRISVIPASRRVLEGARKASTGDLKRIHGLLGELLERSGYSKRHPANARTAVLRRLIYRMELNADDAMVWMGILRQSLHALQEKASDSSSVQV